MASVPEALTQALGLLNAGRLDEAEALNNRGVTLQELKRHDEALASYDRALALRPDYADALYNRGNVLKEMNQLGEALASYDRVLAAKADYAYAFGEAADCAIKLCDWDRRTRFAADLNARLSDKKSIITPFVLLGYGVDSALQLRCARNYIEDKVPLPPRPVWTGQTWRVIAWQVCFWTRFPTTPMRPRATRCGRDCPC